MSQFSCEPSLKEVTESIKFHEDLPEILKEGFILIFRKF